MDSLLSLFLLTRILKISTNRTSSGLLSGKKGFLHSFLVFVLSTAILSGSMPPLISILSELVAVDLCSSLIPEHSNR